MLKGAYTLSRAQNMADDDGWQSLLFNTPSEVDRNYAIAGFDRTQVLQMGFLFEAPIEESNNAFWARVFRHWQVNGVFSAFSGTPFTVTASGTSLNAPGNTQTADLVGTVNVLGGIGPGQPYFDPTAWKAITEPRFGNTGRNSVRGPGQWNIDLSVSRSFALPGGQKIEVRVEAFNLTNTPKFGNPNSNVSGANFMEITSASGERNVRLGLRFAF
jgi:hypothetical protein